MRQITLLTLSLLLASCGCRYVDPSQICGSDFALKILDSNEESIFDNSFILDSLEIRDEFNLPVQFSVNNDANIFQFSVFNCQDEATDFEKPITKIYLLKFTANEIDSLELNFKVVPADCGGTKFGYFNIIYHGQSYQRRGLLTTTVYR